MTNLVSDIVGQVARLPLKPTETNSLLPLFEAVSNSIHAIQDRFEGTEVSEHGKIRISVLREDTEEDFPAITGFQVYDNGIGLDEQNFKSFRTPYSQHKIGRGGKGIGRLGWFKVFSEIHVESKFLNGSGLNSRAFKFVLRDEDQIANIDEPVFDIREPGTVIHLQHFVDEFGTKCPVKTDTIIQRIIAHFLPVFAGDKSPTISIEDMESRIVLQKEFASKITEVKEEIVDVEIDGDPHPILIKHMKCDKSIRPRGSQNNWLCLCADDRGVKEYPIDEQIGLKLLDGKEIYIGAVTGDYLDKHVNTQRTDFFFDAEQGKAIRRQVSDSVKVFLKEYVDKALGLKKETVQRVINKNPQYIYLNPNLDSFVQKLQPNSTSEEAIYIEMAQNRFRRQRSFNQVKKEIDKAPDYNDAISEKVDEYKQFIVDDQKGSLAEYVTKRKAVLDLLDRLRGFEDPSSKKQYLEEAVHQIVCPMRIDSHKLEIDEHNLWLLDDRLAFYNFFASDKPISSYTDADSNREPDLALFYDSCVAWRENERNCDTVIIVEFKRPGLENYTDKNDPMMQLMDYVMLFKSGNSVRDRNGRVISGINENTAFHCYIVADLTDGLVKRLRGHFNPTPDNLGLFGYTRNPDTYTEVIPYEKLFLDAQARNTIFFDKLGLTQS